MSFVYADLLLPADRDGLSGLRLQTSDSHDGIIASAADTNLRLTRGIISTKVKKEQIENIIKNQCHIHGILIM